ncbi:peptidylprolyl isomerase [Candidatus Bipolaricaulota bacterium]|nr:peptidylprolyl isomerase [Candidatus Bipolaricaulota bacterium]TFH08873.1 MAG: hypothetical protein E4H08_06935 [Candidatus Atribacteria bacterium]
MRANLSMLLLLLASLMLCLTAGCDRNATGPADISSDQAVLSDSSEKPADAVAENPGNIVARVNGNPILREDFERAQAQLLLQYRDLYSKLGLDLDAQLEGAPGRLFGLRIEDEALKLSMTRSLVSQELERRGAPVAQDAVEAEFRETFDAFLVSLDMSEQELIEAFGKGEFSGYATGGLTYEQFITNTKQTIRDDFEIQAILPFVAESIEPSQDDLIAYFEEHRSDYEAIEMVRISHVLVADRETAELLLKELHRGIFIETLVRDFSLDKETLAQGGDLGWFTRGQLVRSLEDVAFATPEDEAAIAQTKLGYHLVQVTGYQPEVKPEYSDVADLVAEDFAAETADAHFSQWNTNAHATATILIEDELLRAYNTFEEDADRGLQAFLDLHASGKVDDPYLGYIIGTIYDLRMSKAQAAQEAFNSYMTLTPSMQDEVNRLNAEIRLNRDKAMAFYRESLALLGSDAQIEARLVVLDPLR